MAPSVRALDGDDEGSIAHAARAGDEAGCAGAAATRWGAIWCCYDSAKKGFGLSISKGQTTMEQDSPFGGTVGRTVSYFVSPSTLLTLIPTVVAIAVVMAVSAGLTWLLGLPWPAAMLFNLLAMSPIIGRLTIAAKEGDLKAGFLSPVSPGSVMGFSVRYVLLTLAWGLPMGLIGMWLLGQGLSLLLLGHGLSPSMLSEAMSGRTMLIILGLVFYFAIACAAPSITHLVATRAGALSECFDPEVWRWLWSRRGDLPIFYAALVGGILIFIGLAIPPFLLLGALFFQVNARAAMFFLGLGYIVAIASSPVLMCRLVGAFVWADPSTAPSVVTDSPQPPEAQPTAGEPVPQPIDVAQVLAQLSNRAAGDLVGAIAEAEQLREKVPHNAQVLSELTRMYLRADKIQEALERGAQSISAALAEGAAQVAVEAFSQLRQHRKSLQLAADDWDQLSRALLASSQFPDAAWCFVASGGAGADRIRWLKGMVAVGDAAAKSGQLEVANQVYQHVIKVAPETPTAEYCRQAAVRLKSRLKPRATG